jgi:hypothetical protein
MNKSQIIWLIIRLLGIYLFYLTLLSFLSLLGSVPSLFTLPKLDVSNKNANLTTNSNPPVRVSPVLPDGNFNTNENKANNSADEDSITAKFKGENVKNFAWFLFLTAVYGVAAWYLLRDGRIFFEILKREEPLGLDKQKEPEVTTLNLIDKQN